jgi:hypothetical protein
MLPPGLFQLRFHLKLGLGTYVLSNDTMFEVGILGVICIL